MNGVRAAQLADATAIAAVHVQAWEEAYTGLLPDAVIAARDYNRRLAQWSRMLGENYDTFVAEDDGVVGFIQAGPQRDAELASMGYDGEILALYVLRRAQRLRIGRALMDAAFAALQRRGCRGASLMVLEGNAPALAFYQHCGGTFLSRRPDHLEDGTGVIDLVYGWRPLPAS